MILGTINCQKLSLNSTDIVADTIDFIEARFVFLSDDWDGLEKWAHFARDGEVYDIRLTDDHIRKEDHLNLSAGKWKVYIHGNEFRGGEVVQRVTTNMVTLYVEPTGTLDGEPFPEMPASVTEQILARLEDVEQNGGGSGGGIPRETDPTVPDWAKQPEKPKYTAAEVGAASAEQFNQLSKEIADFGNVNQQLFDWTDTTKLINAYIQAATIPGIMPSTATRSMYVKVKPNCKYTVSIKSDAWSRFDVCTSASLPQASGTASNPYFKGERTTVSNRTYYNVYTSATDNYILVYYYRQASDTLTEEEIRKTLCIREGYDNYTYIDYKAEYPLKTETTVLTSANTLPTLSGNLTTSDGWTQSGWNGNYTNGFSSIAGRSEELQFTLPNVAVNQKFVIEFTCSVAFTYDNLRVTIGDTPIVNLYGMNKDSCCYGVIATETSGLLRFIPSADFTGKISNISVRRILATSESLNRVIDEYGNVVYSERFDSQSRNTLFIGEGAGGNNYAGYGLTGIGKHALRDNISGFWNVAIGDEALKLNSAGSRNVALGHCAMLWNRVGDRNVAIGTFAMRDGVGHSHSTAIGTDAMYMAESSENCIAIGCNSLPQLKGGKGNIAIGRSACEGLQNGNYNLAFGNNAMYSGQTHNYCIAIGHDTLVTKDNQMVLGGRSVHEVVFCGNKKINFNADGTVTWEAV